MAKNKPVYQRILLKLSGEALQGKAEVGLDPLALNSVAQIIKEVVQLKVQVAVVIGGGNFLRGAIFSKTGLNRIASDHMGMLATVMNGIALAETLNAIQVPAQILSSFEIPGFVERYHYHQAKCLLDQGKTLIFAGGTGNPLVSTDSAASLRAIEIEANVVLKATKVDGVYSADPKIDLSAKFYDHISFQEAISRELQVMDLAALYLCREYHVPIRVFNMHTPGILQRIVLGSHEGTLVS